MERRKVVDVPSDNKASPGPDNATTEDELSPVKGATTHSENANQQTILQKKALYEPGLNPHFFTQ